MSVRLAQRDRLRERLARLIEPRRQRRPSADLDVAAAVRQLPPRQRAVVALYYYEDRPLAEIAAMIGCSHSTAKVHLFKARRRLATILGEDFRGGRRCALTDGSATSFVARPLWWSPMSNDISPSCSSAGRRDPDWTPSRRC